MTTTNIPTAVALPPDQVSGPTPLITATAAYAALADIDDSLLPDAAVSIARISHRFAQLRPQPARDKQTAVAAWRQAVRDTVLGTGEPQLPPLGPVAQAVVEEQAAREMSALLHQEWRNAVGPLGGILAANGDKIVTALRPTHDEAWSTFVEHERPLRRYRSETAVLHGDADAAAHFKAAGNALALFERCRHARMQLNRLTGYAAPAVPEAALLFANPTAVAQVKLAKDTLPRWRSIAEHYRAAEPKLLTRDEALQAHEAAQQAAKQRRYGIPA